MNIKPWRADVKRWLELPAIVRGENVIVTSRHHRIEGLKAGDGSRQWSTDLSDEILQSPVLVGEDTLLVQGREGDGGSFHGLDTESGEVRWSKQFSPRWKYSDAPSSQDAVVLRRDPLAGSDSEPMLLGLSPAGGETLWEVPARGESWGVPVQDSENRLFVNVRSDEGESILAVDGSQGSVLWSAPGEVWGRPQPIDSGLLVARRDGLSVLDSGSGEVKWNREQRMGRQPFVAGGSVVVGSPRPDGIPGTRLTGLDAESGEPLWNYDTANLTGLAKGPNDQLLHHAVKIDSQGKPFYYLHALDSRTGEPQWSVELGESKVLGVGYDAEGRVAIAVALERDKELLVVENGEILWRRPVEGEGVSVVSNGPQTAVLDGQGVTVVDSETGEYRGQAGVNSPLVNYDGAVSGQGRLALSGIDGEVVSLELPGAETVLEATSQTPGRMRHYRYDMREDEHGRYYADVQADGFFVPGEDALLVSRPVDDGHQHLSLNQGVETVTESDLTGWDHDQSGYLSREEMNEANLSLWWDRDFDDKVSPRDGMVAMAGEGNRQAVIDLDRQKIEVRTRR